MVVLARGTGGSDSANPGRPRRYGAARRGNPAWPGLPRPSTRSLLLVGLIACAVGVLLVLLLSRRVPRFHRGLDYCRPAVGRRRLVQPRQRQRQRRNRPSWAMLSTPWPTHWKIPNVSVAAWWPTWRTNCGRPCPISWATWKPCRTACCNPTPPLWTRVHQQTLYLNRLVSDLRLLAETEASELRLLLESRIHR